MNEEPVCTVCTVCAVCKSRMVVPAEIWKEGSIAMHEDCSRDNHRVATRKLNRPGEATLGKEVK